MGSSRSIEVSRIMIDDDVWPRFRLNAERVADFAELYQADGVGALPPIEVVRLVDGTTDVFLLAEGRTRVEALLELGIELVPAVVHEAGDRDPHALAYEIALRTAATSALPLTRSEKHAAISRLVAESEVSDREIGRLVGVAHTTVGRLRRREETATAAPDDDGEEWVRTSAETVARRLAGGLMSLWDKRGLSDLLLGDRMGSRLADALEARCGDEALAWAQRLERWGSQAAERLAE